MLRFIFSCKRQKFWVDHTAAPAKLVLYTKSHETYFNFAYNFEYILRQFTSCVGSKMSGDELSNENNTSKIFLDKKASRLFIRIRYIDIWT